MYRPASRTVLRTAAQSSLAPARTIVGRRFASTTPVNGRRSWKSSALRWGIAVAGIYYYNTSPVFAEQPQHHLLNPNLEHLEDTQDHQSLEELTTRRARNAEKNASQLHSAVDAISTENASTTVVSEHEVPLSTDDGAGAGGVAALEEEAGQQGAFNPETGEINWDCPCLGGMADGPCGPEFKEAFSCFVFSQEEPKGMDCIDKFQNMQQCFQRHPDVYKGELEDDEELDAELEGERQELVKEIAERKAQQEQRESGIGERRLLEEPAPAASKPATKSTKKSKSKSEKKATSSQGPASGTQDQPSSESKTTASPPSSLKSEFVDDAPSSIIRNPTPPPVEESAVPEGDLLPRAAHDARGQVGVIEHETEK
ncbi:hypothetical protein LTR84_005071 [Exophiala bonariae]|uniref:Mitochondrial intermembrane space import and assembly protein 40 n=1 Tax=Exophiala bonariae TaxID=1690606 RepID=A0AAV9NP57_9EURO|nr:hypothetical protein LTR84_005071 [Exophiala bonariae]